MPQVICEYKDMRSSLDAPQRRKNTRSPVKQGLDYLSAARRTLMGSEVVTPTWLIVTDMNEFRLYWSERGSDHYMRFLIDRKDLFAASGVNGTPLTFGNEEARFQRFLFAKLFHANMLLSMGGPCRLRQLIDQQWAIERKLEKEFYNDYRDYREFLFASLQLGNQQAGFSPGKLLKLAQKLLDRFIFIMFCEDMGQRLAFPPHILRDYLRDESTTTFYDPDGDEIWVRLKRLFKAMDIGGKFGTKKINVFNGGLFAHDPDIEQLHLTNSVFCELNQGHNPVTVLGERKTLLYLSATYNFSIQSDQTKSISLYTLGRIFEQSITELEMREAEVEGRASLNKASKRKTDGVYYTPEWVVERIVADTLGPCLAELRVKAGWQDGTEPDAQTLNAYQALLKSFTVVDPACGSGAFLITVLRYLINEWRELHSLRETLGAKLPPFDERAVVNEVLANNIYGVDINPSSVELTKLSLWLHTANSDTPLSGLNHTIRDGNSLIGPDFYEGEMHDSLSEMKRELVNVFDWQATFPEVFEKGGFDCVVGNPPYVKLQNFTSIYPEMSDYLRDGRISHKYQSTQTGNFDLYLPFIEKGLALLNERGRMGYIAPSLWVNNDYGVALRQLVRRGQHLDRWLDFKAFQVFDEAITYTALQFFTKFPSPHVRVQVVPDGDVTKVTWRAPALVNDWQRFNHGEPWLMAPGPVSALIDRLQKAHKRLDDPAITREIFVGLQTSADSIYHLEKLGPGNYRAHPNGDGAAPYEVQLEDALMKPLVSGPEAKRYRTPQTETYLLFPYAPNADGVVRLIAAEAMAKTYPKAWEYLKSHEPDLRRREGGKFNDADWYMFGRHQNLDKQEIPKLIVAQTVPEMRVCFDDQSALYLNNVRVNGIVPLDDNGWYLLGLLNTKLLDFIFRWIAAPKMGGFYEANKQYIAPLPICLPEKATQHEIAALARQLQIDHSERARLLGLIKARLGPLTTKARGTHRQPWHWLFPELPTPDALEAKLAKDITRSERRKRVDMQMELLLSQHFNRLEMRLNTVTRMEATLTDGELRFSIDGIPEVRGVFVEAAPAPFLLAQWHVIADSFTGSSGKKLADSLRSIQLTASPAIQTQVTDYATQLITVGKRIAEAEAALNARVLDLYELTEAEQALVSV